VKPHPQVEALLGSVLEADDQAVQEYLAAKGLKEEDPGVAVGAKAAAGIIADTSPSNEAISLTRLELT